MYLCIFCKSACVLLLPWLPASPVHQCQYVQHGGHIWVGVAGGLLQVLQCLWAHEQTSDTGSAAGPPLSEVKPVCRAVRPPRTGPGTRTGSPGCEASGGERESRSRPAAPRPLRCCDAAATLDTDMDRSVMNTSVFPFSCFYTQNITLWTETLMLRVKK